MSTYYLKSNVCAEPLVNRWYASPLLISPATAALITVNSHINIIQSYIRMPKMHALAVRDPRMRGGPFVDFGGVDLTKEATTYLQDLQNNCKHIIKFADAIKTLNTLMQTAGGHGLHDWYSKIPNEVRGFVELGYDANHHPNFRLIEPLLYRSQYYQKQNQVLALSVLLGDYRPFILSTPKIAAQHELMCHVPFADPNLDLLFGAREHGITQETLRQLNATLKNDRDDAALENLFTEEKPSEAAAYQGDDVRIRYFGHACVLIETKETSILIDPIISYQYETETSRFTYSDLPKTIDYVILTHAQQDHVALEHLLQLRYKIKNIIVPKNIPGAIQDPSLKLMFQQLNFKNVFELGELEALPITNGEIIGIPFFGAHGDLQVNSKIAYLVIINNKKILLAADSNNLEPNLYAFLQQDFPTIDVAFIGMACDGAPMSWLYGPILGKNIGRAMDASRRLDGSDCDKALDIVRRFDCKNIYVYALGQEPWLGYVTSADYTQSSKPIVESDRFIKICREEGRNAERLYIKEEIIL